MIPRDELLAAAREYAAGGLRVFPVRAHDKAPPCFANWATHATTDTAIISGWWSGRFQDSNIGLLCSGLLVVDIDVPEGRQTLECLIAEHGELPRTVTSRTPTGGFHFLFWCNHPGLGPSAGKLGERVDTRAARSYVVLPPSIRPEGRYRWVKGRGPGEIGMAKAPEWLVTLAAARPPQPEFALPPLTAPRRNGTANGDRLADYAFDRELEIVRTAREGTRNATLYIASRKLARFIAAGQLIADEVQAALLDAAQTAGLPVFEATATINSAFRSTGESPCRS
jgi:bifunctional DNA primase/polymerase-like protein